MFDDTKEPQDIFAQTDKAAPQVLPPTAASVQSPEPLPTESTPGVEAGVEATPGVGRGGSWKVMVTVLAIIVVIGGAFLISWRILRSRTPVTPPSPSALNTSSPAPESEPETDSKPTPGVEAGEPALSLDKDADLDGLSDLREAQLGTNPGLPDTDGDGLFDREEVDVYGTDPLDSDTDDDGYQDGEEVKGGYNPKGSGKLLRVPTGS